MTATIFSLFGRACIRAPLLIALACLVPATAAQAKSFDAVDIAVEAFAIAGPSVGVGINIGQTEKVLVKSLIRCAVDGAQVLDCARKELVKQLPEEVQPFADCMLKGQRIERCASAQAISMLPPQLHGVANCIADGNNIAQCGKRFATDQLSQAKLAALDQVSATLDRLKTDAVGAHPLVKTPSSIQNIIGVAKGIKEGNAGAVVLHGSPELLKAAGRIILNVFLPAPLANLLAPASDALIQNRFDLVVNMAKAVEAGDERRIGDLTIQALIYLHLPVAQACALIPEGGFKDVVCGFAADVVAFFGGVGGDVAVFGIDTVRDICTGVGIDCSGFLGIDPECGTPQSFYAKNFPACVKQGASLRVTDPQQYENVVKGLNGRCRAHFQKCNERFIVGGTSEALDKICNPLRDTFKDDVAKLGNGLEKIASRYAKAYGAITINAPMNGSCNPEEAMRRFIPDCVKALEAQLPKLKDEPNCGGGDWTHLPRADVFAAACRAGADKGYGGSLKVVCNFQWTKDTCAPPWRIEPNGTCFLSEAAGEYTCIPGESYNKERQQCEPDPRRPIATAPPMSPVLPPPPSVTPREVLCTDGMVPNAAGGCGCPEGTVLRRESGKRGRCVPDTAQGGAAPSCRPGMVPKVGGGCDCPQGTHFANGACVQGGAAPSCRPGMVAKAGGGCDCPPGRHFANGACVQGSAAPSCRPGMVAKAGGGCDCPPGRHFANGACVQGRAAPSCRPGMVPKAGGGCDCPAGMAWRGDRCTVISCPQGMQGTPPNCHRPAPPPPRVCPQGMVGTPPNCSRPAPPPPRVCPQGMVGTPPNCSRPAPPLPRVCPQGMQGTPPNCYRPAPPPPRVCPQGMQGTPPNCSRPAPPPPRVCPQGMQGTPPNCSRPAPPPPRVCPQGMVGTPPNCSRPAPPRPRVCPQGMQGTPPNCYRPAPPVKATPPPRQTCRSGTVPDSKGFCRRR